MNENDLVRLHHMLDAAREADGFVQGKNRQSLDTDRLLVLGLSYAIGIIGEAASKVSQEVQTATPQIPWAQIIGMRNRLIHGYFDIKLDRLWATVTESIPPLIAQLDQIIPPEQPEQNE